MGFADYACWDKNLRNLGTWYAGESTTSVLLQLHQGGLTVMFSGSYVAEGHPKYKKGNKWNLVAREDICE